MDEGEKKFRMVHVPEILCQYASASSRANMVDKMQRKRSVLTLKYPRRSCVINESYKLPHAILRLDLAGRCALPHASLLFGFGVVRSHGVSDEEPY